MIKNMYLIDGNPDFGLLRLVFHNSLKRITGYITPDTDEAWNDLREKYCNQERSYHDMKHIAEMLRTQCNAMIFFSLLSNLRHAIRYAIIFHDYRMTFGAENDDEEQSAEVAVSYLSKYNVLKSTKEKVQEMILATKHDKFAPSLEAQFVADIDLFSLSSEWGIFCKNTKNIRNEYSRYSDEEFTAGRVEFFRKFLASRHSIYQTQYFKENFEQKAYSNIKHYISLNSK